MRTPLSAVAVACLLATTAAAGTEGGAPQDAGEIVAELAYRGGQRRPRLPSPYLIVTRDSLVIVRSDSRPRRVHREGAADAILTLAEEVGFFDMDSETLRREVRERLQRSGRLPSLHDGATTAVTLRRDDRAHTVEFYAPAFYAARVPDHPGLAGFLRLATHLEDVAVHAEAAPR